MSKKTEKFYRDELISIMKEKMPYILESVFHTNCHDKGGYFAVMCRFNDNITARRNIDDHIDFNFDDIFTAQKFYNFAINKMHESKRVNGY